MVLTTKVNAANSSKDKNRNIEYIYFLIIFIRQFHDLLPHEVWRIRLQPIFKHFIINKTLSNTIIS